jgi:hypothetical protein
MWLGCIHLLVRDVLGETVRHRMKGGVDEVYGGYGSLGFGIFEVPFWGIEVFHDEYIVSGLLK